MLRIERWSPIRTDVGLSVLIASDKPTRVQAHLLNRLQRVHVNTEGKISDLQLLEPWASRLRSLVITDHGVRDVSAVARMLELENLVVYGGSRLNCPTSLNDHQKLTAFAGSWDRGWAALWNVPHLRSIDLERPPAAIAGAFAHVDSLRSITLRAVQGTLDLGARPMRLVTHLRLGNARLERTALRGWTGLQDLMLQNVRLDSWDFLEQLPRLTRLIIEDCGDIPSLIPLRVPPLEEFRLIGRTNVLDGNMLCLRGLREASFPVQDHYNAAPDDLITG